MRRLVAALMLVAMPAMAQEGRPGEPLSIGVVSGRLLDSDGREWQVDGGLYLNEPAVQTVVGTMTELMTQNEALVASLNDVQAQWASAHSDYERSRVLVIVGAVAAVLVSGAIGAAVGYGVSNARR